MTTFLWGGYIRMYLEKLGLVRHDYQWEKVILSDVPDASDVEENKGFPFSHCIYTYILSLHSWSYDITGPLPDSCTVKPRVDLLNWCNSMH